MYQIPSLQTIGEYCVALLKRARESPTNLLSPVRGFVFFLLVSLG